MLISERLSGWYSGRIEGRPRASERGSEKARFQDYVRTDSASLRFFRQHIASLLSPRTDSASLRLVAEATAVRDGPVLVRSRCSAGCVRETLRVATRETAGMGGETRAGLPHHRPRSPLPGDAPDGPCRLEPTPAGVDSVGSG